MKKPTKKKSAPAPAKPAKRAKGATVTSKPVAKTPAKTAAKAPTPVTRKPAPRPTFTIISAQIDVGFGNTLHIRGEGGGLSWDEGVAMTCAADDAWTIKLPAGNGPVTFKFLLNDLIWCGGENYVVSAGANISLVPLF